ncbi:MAG: hypothetical protein ABI830_07765, partial [Pseudolabrys sp.]
MDDISYQFKPGGFARERTYHLLPAALEWQDGRTRGQVAYADILRVEVCKERFLGSSASYWRCVLYPASGPAIKLGAASRVGLRRIEDRTAIYIPFIKDLEARVLAANPQRVMIDGVTWLSRLEEAGGRAIVFFLHVIRNHNPDRWADVAAWIARRIGPWLRGHRTARSQLVAAFPEKSSSEIERILGGMWDNLARTTIEYSQLDKLWERDPVRMGTGRIEVGEETIDRWNKLLAGKQRVFAFSAHLANWELAAIAIPAQGKEAIFPVRPPKIKAFADELIRIRTKAGCTPISSGPDAIAQIRNAVKRDAFLGILSDQYQAGGVEVTFFGRRCALNPLLVRLTRTFDAQLYGTRMIRLPGGRFRYEIVGPV